MKQNFVIAESFIRTLNNKIYKYMTSVSKNDQIDRLDDIVYKYNNSIYTSQKNIKVQLK